MQRKLKLWQKILLLIIIVTGLACVRIFENVLFNDPFLAFFHGENFKSTLPDFDFVPLGFGYLIRYLLNTILSLAAIFVIFNDWKLLKFAATMYVILFIVLMLSLFAILFLEDPSLNMILFYVRRFIIQPMLLLLFVPAFFYQESTREKI